MKFLSYLTVILVILGGLNWLFVALDYNVVEKWFGSMPALVDTIYWLIGLSAIYQILIGSSRTISNYSFITRVLSTIMYLTLFVFIKTLALASDSIASYAVIIENKLTVSCIVGYNSESLKIKDEK